MKSVPSPRRCAYSAAIGFWLFACQTFGQQANYAIPSGSENLPGSGPIRRYDWFQDLWQRKRQQWSQSVARDKHALVFLGDSITQGWGENLSLDFASIKVANRGISGDTTRGMLVRLKEDVLALQPQGVVMLMGTNDLEEGATPETIASNVDLILGNLAAHRADLPVLLCAVFPSSETVSRPEHLIRQTNQQLAQVAASHANVTYLDTWTLFADANGNAKRDEFPDLLHPNRKGYEKWRDALLPILATWDLVDRDWVPKREPGFESLFRGYDLTGWEFRPSSDADRRARDNWKRNDPNAPPWPILTETVNFEGEKQTTDGRYVALNGRLVVTTPREGRRIQQLWTTRDFDQDFVLKLEFRATPNADSGVFLRGKQLQCRDYALAGPYKHLKAYRPQGWNELVCVVRGTSAHCTCNGEVLESNFEVPRSGPIGLEGDRGQVEYRNIRIKLLSSELPRASPETQGVSSQALLQFVSALDGIDAVHSVMVLRHGHVIAEGWWAPYTPNDPHQLYSLSKSFTSTAVGLAIAEGKFSLDDPVVSFFPEEAPREAGNHLKAMRVRDLLTMSTGHDADDLAKFSFQSEQRLTELFLSLPVTHRPGTHFLYNTPATYMCSAIVQRTTEMPVVDYLQARLFDPLRIRPPLWTHCPQGISHGGFGLNLRTEDIARFGLLCLQEGEWEGQQIVPRDWVRLAASRQTANGSDPHSDWNQGYGFQFWQCRHGAYRGDGAFGQFCIVHPATELVIAITSGTGNMGAVMQAAWDHLLPGLAAASLPPNDEGRAELERKLDSLEIQKPRGSTQSSLARTVSDGVLEFPENDLGISSMKVDFDSDEPKLMYTDGDGSHTIRFLFGEWCRQRVPSLGGLVTRVPDPRDLGVAATAAWDHERTLKLKICLYETPYCLDLDLGFGDRQVSLSGKYNVGFDNKPLPKLVGLLRGD